ncbi:helix-hairpin-helix domain-containing protein [Bradyrhizobium tunisiense]|uniref:helix-hairpin-helix domain-containing protein n=1 Tax=Bradyrhizobium tunisiense TaxID=3278709 RepID=UPI0035D8F982
MSPAPSNPEVVDSLGRPILLGQQLGAGGEGVVYEVRQNSDKAAKVYLKALTQERVEKIRAMSRMPSDELRKRMSWPIDLLLHKRTGQPAGLLIPRVHNKKNVHHLYGPKSRLQDFPSADWRFLVHAAANIAIAFVKVHEANCVIGDVNHGSIMVGTDATVSLIDCESFQVNVEGRQYRCEVGIETFSPPELQGVTSYRNISRTPNFDNFGLAVMIFHLLFMGRHPFAGKFAGPANMPIPQAIKECRFPYSANHKAMQMDRPPGTPPLSFVGSEVAQLFETAFSATTVSGGRPTARDWAAALDRIEKNAKQCSVSKGHWHPGHLSACPWCAMEAQGANPLFPFVVPLPADGSKLDVDTLWRQIQNLPDLGNAPMIASQSKQPSARAVQAGRPSTIAKPAASLIGVAIFLGGSITFPPVFWLFAVAGIAAYNILLSQFTNDGRIVPFRSSHYDAERQFNNALSDWQTRAGPQPFITAKNKFEACRTELASIPAKRARALEALRQNHRKLQLDRYLDRFEIEDAKIDGIGPGRKGTLASYGIETAEDLTPNRILAVPGFGPVMNERLMSWRQSLEARFVFDPKKAIDPRDIINVEQQFQTLRLKAEAALKSALAEALQAHARILSIRQSGRAQLDLLQSALAQAKADLDFVRGQ